MAKLKPANRIQILKVLLTWGLAALTVSPFWNFKPGPAAFFVHGTLPLLVVLFWCFIFAYMVVRGGSRWGKEGVNQRALWARYAAAMVGASLMVGVAYQRNSQQLEAWQSLDETEQTWIYQFQNQASLVGIDTTLKEGLPDEAYFQYALQAWRAGKLDSAQAYMERIVQTPNVRVEWLATMAALHRRQGNFTEALTYYEICQAWQASPPAYIDVAIIDVTSYILRKGP